MTIIRKLSFKELLQGSYKFFLMKRGKTLFGLNLEVTLRCNLRCDFCNYGRRNGPEERLEDYTPIIRRLNPLHLTITGGEPLLRKDLERVIQQIRKKTSFVYINLITNGSLLTPERALALWRAGLNQLSVSLDFPDQRHDAHRTYPGLWDHLSNVLPHLAGTEMDNLCLNTVIMRENLTVLPKIVQVAKNWGFKVSFSAYNPFKNNNPDHFVSREELKTLDAILKELAVLKQQNGNITNSSFYLANVSRYFREGGIPGCLAGKKWVQVSPDGSLRRCPDKEKMGPWEEFNPKRVPHTPCRECWYACRGEAEAPLGLKRIVELNR
jgi:MoaA/NifB/PqqE/SkfB family radical SAM enzyme